MEFIWLFVWVRWYALCCCFHVVSDKVFIIVIRSMSLKYIVECIELVSKSYHIVICNISSTNHEVRLCLFVFVFLNCLKLGLSLLWLEDTASKAEYASQLTPFLWIYDLALFQSYLGRSGSIAFLPFLWNLVLTHACLFLGKKSGKYSAFLFNELYK